MLNLSFLGASGTVTGSKYLLENEGRRLLVDCGLFQGYKALRLRNWAPLPVDPREIEAVILTHAHLDHSGYLPLLAKNGFRGRIFCSEATAELCAILLTDAGHLQERDAEFANRHGFSKHHPALPLYTEEDAVRVLESFVTIPFDRTQALDCGAHFVFRRMGHILGAASVDVSWDARRIVFSGDVGRYGDEIMNDPVEIDDADYLVVESTYGNKLHDRTNVDSALADIVGKTVHRGGTVVVPAFAVGRAQSILFHLEKLKSSGQIPAATPIFLDSPMAIDASDIFCRNSQEHRLTPSQCRAFAAGAHYVRDAQESKALFGNPVPKVIISASGMATGGRILHHLKHYAPDPRNTILFTGFQAGGTRGAAIVAGAQSVKIHGAYVSIRAEVHNLEMLSAHADSAELLRWLRGFKRPPKCAFITHGEPEASDALRHRVEEELHWSCVVPDQGQIAQLA